jgi:hypothetical protein
MDNRINEIRRKISALRTEMMGVEAAMRDQVRQDLDCTGSALQLMTLRTRLSGLVADWKAAGGSQPLPTIGERLRSGHRPARRPNTVAQRRP